MLRSVGGSRPSISPGSACAEGGRRKGGLQRRNHRIIEWFGLEGTLKITWFQPPCHEQVHLPLDQVAQSSIQRGLEHCQGEGIHSLPEEGSYGLWLAQQSH